MLIVWPSYLIYVHHTSPETGIHYRCFHVYHGSLLLRRVKLPEALAKEVTKGMFVPSLQGKNVAANTIALFGVIITERTLIA